MNITAIILEAQKQLVLSPIDLAHDITHHQRVYELSLKIVEDERLKIDNDLLAVCAWYHDLGGRKGENVTLIKELINKHTSDNSFIEKVIKIIHEHSFGKRQTTTESKVLFDADKLEYVNPFRLSGFLKAYHDGFLSQEKYNQYKREWAGRIDQVKKMLHFSSSRKTFAELYPAALKIMES